VDSARLQVINITARHWDFSYKIHRAIMKAIEKQAAEIHGKELADLDRPLWELLHNSAEQRPDAEAVVSLWQRKSQVYVLAEGENDVRHF
jgi:hypothetical protein